MNSVMFLIQSLLEILSGCLDFPPIGLHAFICSGTSILVDSRWLNMLFYLLKNHAEISLLWWQCWAVGPHGRFVLCGWELMGTCFSLGNRLLTMWLWLLFSLANTSDFFSIFAVGISGFTKSCNTWPSSLELGLFSLQNYEQNKAKQNLFSLYITQSGIFWYGNRESTQIGLYETTHLVGYLSSLCFSSRPQHVGIRG